MQLRSEKTRELIVKAATELFCQSGLDGVSIQDISKSSGVSNGSIFHHYGSKDGVAIEVYLAERRKYWDAATTALETFEGDPVDAIGEAVRAALAYQEKHPNRHNFMVECASSEWMLNHAKPVQALNDEFTARFAVWAMPHLKVGRLKPLNPQLYAALVFGPTQWLARAWLTGLSAETPTFYADDLAALVIRALQQ